MPKEHSRFKFYMQLILENSISRSGNTKLNTKLRFPCKKIFLVYKEDTSAHSMPPLVSVITPYYRESEDILRECHESIVKQKGNFAIQHFMVADGHPLSQVAKWDCFHTSLPQAHKDAGNTARGIGCILAEKINSDFITFLDADNWYHDNHIDSLLSLHYQVRSAVTTCFRTFHSTDGTELKITESDEDSLSHVDTSCLLLHKNAFSVNTVWQQMPKELWGIGDRILMSKIIKERFSMASTRKRTVAYRTLWQFHYNSAGILPPQDAKSAQEVTKPCFDYLRTTEGVQACIDKLGFWPVGCFSQGK